MGCQAKQRQFVRAFDHAAAGCDGGGAGDVCCGSGFGDAVGEDEFHVLLNAQLAGEQAAFFEREGGQRVRALILSPRKDLGVRVAVALGNLLSSAFFFEAGRDIERLAAHGDDHDEHALAIAPADAGEVIERGAAGKADAVDLLFRHELLRLGDAGAALIGGDGLRFRLAALELSDSGSRNGCHRGGSEEVSAGGHEPVYADLLNSTNPPATLASPFGNSVYEALELSICGCVCVLSGS